MSDLTWQVMLVWKGCPSSVSAVAGDSTHCAQLTVRDGCASLVFYMVFILSFFARWRPESTASIKWPISFLAARPSICPLRVWFFEALYFFMYSLLFSIQHACLFLYHVCQINNNSNQVVAVETISNLFPKVCIKYYKWGWSYLLSFHFSIFSVSEFAFCCIIQYIIHKPLLSGRTLYRKWSFLVGD